MTIVVAVLLGLCAAGFVLYPIYREMPAQVTRRNQRLAEQQLAGEAAHSIEYEQAARNALQEVELDYQLGNIVETDYNQLHDRYMRRALVAMRTRYEREQELDAAIEEQLRQMREQEHQEDEAQ